MFDRISQVRSLVLWTTLVCCAGPWVGARAAGAVVEAFRAGELGRADARPIVNEQAHADATPVHIGLGKDAAFDLPVTFPGKEPLEFRNVAAKRMLGLTPEGKLDEPAAPRPAP